MKILLLGASGQVGWELRNTLLPLGDLTTTGRAGRCDEPLDLTDLDALSALLDRVQPALIVNAAAYTAVDQAESEPELARQVNAAAPAHLGHWAARNGARVVHYSTDYVYDGRKPSPYVESDDPNPLGVYGRTKLFGDEALLASGCDPLILRVGWVYGRRGRNFLLTMQRLMRERDILRIVRDQVGAPTWCRRIAEITAEVLQSGERGTLATGVYHLAPSGETSWFGFASAIRDQGGLDCALAPIPSTEYPTPAARPANSRLDTTKLQRTFGIEANDWSADLAACLAPESFSGSGKPSRVSLVPTA